LYYPVAGVCRNQPPASLSINDLRGSTVPQMAFHGIYSEHYT
jgi:hypothetical protein